MGKPESRSKWSEFEQEAKYFSYTHPRLTRLYKVSLGILCCPLACLFYYCGCQVRVTDKCGTGRREARRRKRAEMSALRVEKKAQKARPRSRRKSLSIPGWHSRPDDKSEVGRSWGMTAIRTRESRKGETYGHRQSPLFLKLPVEVRRMIWEEVVGGEAHITFGEKLGSSRFMEPMSVWCDDGSNIAPYESGREYTRDVKTGLLDLLKTCRAIYTEVLPLLYATPTFTFSSPTAFLAFTTLPIAKAHIERVRHVVFNFSFPDWFPPYDGTPRKNTYTLLARHLPRLTGLRRLSLSVLADGDFGKKRCLESVQDRCGEILDAAPGACCIYLFLDVERVWWEVFEVSREHSKGKGDRGAEVGKQGGKEKGHGRKFVGRGRYPLGEPITLRELEEKNGEDVPWGTVVKPI